MLWNSICCFNPRKISELYCFPYNFSHKWNTLECEKKLACAISVLSCDFGSFFVTLPFEFWIIMDCLDSVQDFLWFWFIFMEVVLEAFQIELRLHLKLNPMIELNKIFKLNHMLFRTSVIYVRCTMSVNIVYSNGENEGRFSFRKKQSLF